MDSMGNSKRPGTWRLDHYESASGLERIVEAVGELLHTEHAEALFKCLCIAGWDGVLE